MENGEKSDLPKFVCDLKELHNKQRRDIATALTGTSGLYIVQEEYAEFAVRTESWKLGQEKYISKVADLPPMCGNRRRDPLQPIGQLSHPLLLVAGFLAESLGMFKSSRRGQGNQLLRGGLLERCLLIFSLAFHSSSTRLNLKTG